jgi:tetratricopeptide (TPR) repeat protein
VASTDEPGTLQPTESLRPPSGDRPKIEVLTGSPVHADWRSRIVGNGPWLNVVTPVAVVVIAAITLVPSLVSMCGKDESKRSHGVDARGATNTVTLGDGAQVRGGIHLSGPAISKADLDQRHAELLRAIAAEKGVPVQALMVVLRKLGERDVPQEEIPRRLAAKADELLALRALLQSLTPPEAETARREALQHLDNGDLDGARMLLQKAREPFTTQRKQHVRAEAALLADEAKIDGLELHYLAAAAKYEACAAHVHFDRDSKATYLELQADSLYSQGHEFGDNGALERALDVRREVLRMRSRERQSLAWASAQNSLGKVLQILGDRERAPERLLQAVQAYQQALLEQTRERVPLDWARTQSNLGNALRMLGEREGNAERLQQAADAYQQALLEQTQERVPLDWAMTQSNLGVALAALGERESRTDRLRQAVQACEQALLELTRESVPLDWAMTQSNLGVALAALGVRQSGSQQLQLAVQAFEQALLEWTRSRAPLDWARTQHNLGGALELLGEREDGTDRLLQAVQAFEQALLERTRKHVPLAWASTQNNLGNALAALGERENGTDRLLQAVQAYEQASVEQTRERAPLRWASTQNNSAPPSGHWESARAGPSDCCKPSVPTSKPCSSSHASESRSLGPVRRTTSAMRF